MCLAAVQIRNMWEKAIWCEDLQITDKIPEASTKPVCNTLRNTLVCYRQGNAVIVYCNNASQNKLRAVNCTRLVLISRTPQLMSNPTPPGDTTDSGSAMSNAATFPIAKPYPEWTSGSAIDFCSKGCEFSKGDHQVLACY